MNSEDYIRDKYLPNDQTRQLTLNSIKYNAIYRIYNEKHEYSTEYSYLPHEVRAACRHHNCARRLSLAGIFLVKTCIVALPENTLLYLQKIQSVSKSVAYIWGSERLPMYQWVVTHLSGRVRVSHVHESAHAPPYLNK